MMRIFGEYTEARLLEKETYDSPYGEAVLFIK